MNQREEINARLSELSDGFRYLADLDELTDEQRSQFDEATTEFETLEQRAKDFAERDAAAARVASVPSLQIIQKPVIEDTLNDRTASMPALGESVVRSLESRGMDADSLSHVRSIMKRHTSDPSDRNYHENRAWAQNLAARSTDVYSQAWSKVMAGTEIGLLPDEQRAAMAEGTNTAGGYLLPTHLDPTLILTNAGSSNAIRGMARVVTQTVGNTWHGISGAGSDSSWDGELVEVSDDSQAFSNPSVTIYKAQNFQQASVEVLEDALGLQADIAMAIADSRDRLEGAAHATGSGSGQPFGIFTALSGGSYELVTTTANLVDDIQLRKVYRTVPVRWRGKSEWLMNPLFLGTIQALGTALGSLFTTDLSAAYTQRLLGRPVVESDDAPSGQTTTLKDPVLVFGDFSNYVIADKPGSTSTHYIPPGILQNTANNLPDGRVGWYTYWRSGADSVNDAAFIRLVEKTSA